MSNTKTDKVNKEKPAGTVLAGRYKLVGSAGRGGFSIVYEATDLQSGIKVAVKECTILSEKERFLREAEMLEKYAEEDAIVSVLDYFEENDTAYIVMEYLDGENLRDCIEKKSKWTMEETVQRMSPVMKTLEHMHSNNVIHRDISPDNLMVLGDGSLKLLDFGAAKQYEDSTLSRLVVKASYSPPEQMDAKGIFGSWSDVYSICAAMYFCITGKNPEDAISRLMMDDLKKPSELGADILPAAERILMRGMALDSNERIQGMAPLRDNLEKIYPILTEEEKKAIEKKKKRRRFAIASAALLLLVGVLIVINYDAILGLYNQHLYNKYTREVEKLEKSGKSRVILDGSNMTDEEFTRNAEIVEHRIDTYSKGRVKYKRGDHLITFDVASDTYGDIDIVSGIELDISYPKELCITDEQGTFHTLLPSKDVKNAKYENKKITIEFSKDVQRIFKDRLNKKGEKLIVSYDKDYYFSPPWFEVDCLGDGKTVEFDSEHEEDAEINLLPWKNDPLTKPFGTDVEWNIKWEDIDSFNWVHSQDIACFKYQSDVEADADSQDANEDSQKMIKSRLDALSIPYAIGTDIHDNSLVVSVPLGMMSCEMATVLCEHYLGNISIGSLNLPEHGVQTLWFEYKKYESTNDDQNNSVILTRRDSDSHTKEEILNLLRKLKSEGEDSLYVFIGTYLWPSPIAKMDIDSAIDAVENDNDLEFTNICAVKGKEKELVDYFRAIMLWKEMDEIAAEYRNYRFMGMQLRGKSGSVITDSTTFGISAIEAAGLEKVAEWEKQYEDKRFFVNSDMLTDKGRYPNPIRLGIQERNSSEKTVEEAVSDFGKFYKQNIKTMENSTFSTVSYSSPGRLSISIGADPDGRIIISSLSAYENEEKADDETIKRIFKLNNLSKLITDDTEFN